GAATGPASVASATAAMARRFMSVLPILRRGGTPDASCVQIRPKTHKVSGLITKELAGGRRLNGWPGRLLPLPAKRAAYLASRSLLRQQAEGLSWGSSEPQPWEYEGLLFIPLSDDNPLKFLRYQWVTVGIIAANVLVFILQLSGLGLATGTSFAVVPAELVEVGIVSGAAHGPYDAIPVPEAATLLTYMFLHADVVHLASNMMFLWVFGDNVEDAMGHVRYLLFYLLCGIAGALAQTVMEPQSQLPLIGASGAVAGTIAAYLILHPRVLVWVLAFRIIPL